MKKILSLLLVAALLVAALPTALAAPKSDIPDEMLNNAVIDALQYIGYKANTQMENGTIYQYGYFGNRLKDAADRGDSAAVGILSGIGYNLGSDNFGTETKDDGTPDIGEFKKDGLVCASFVAYYYLNYLPNVAGVDTDFLSKAIAKHGGNTKAVSTWENALDDLSKSQPNLVQKVYEDNSGTEHPPKEIWKQVKAGDAIKFGNTEKTFVHMAVYLGEYTIELSSTQTQTLHFIAHVGNDNGPEISATEYLAITSESEKPSYVSGIYHFENLAEQYGQIEIIKKDADTGANLAGAVFTAVHKETGDKYTFLATDANGHTKMIQLPYGTYTVKETKFPAGYQASGATSWTVTIPDSSGSNVITLNVKNEQIPGDLTIVKTSEDGKVSGITFKVTGNGVNKTATTDRYGKILIEDLKPGTYTVTETVADKYEPQSSQTVKVESGKTATVSFDNKLKRGTVKVTKTSEDGLVKGVTFRLTGTSLSGAKVDLTATTNSKGVATFNNVLISNSTGYTLTEVDTAKRYVIPAAQNNVKVEWNKVTNASFKNVLKKWRAQVAKVDSVTGGAAQGNATLQGAVYGVYKDGVLTDRYTTDAQGKFVTNYYPCGDNTVWTIREISPSAGYTLDTTVYTVDTSAAKYTVERNTVNMTVREQIVRGKIALIKHTDDGATQIETPEAGAEFEVFLKNAGSFANAKESERVLLVTDEDGYAESKELPYGVYTVKQIKGTDGFALMPAFDVDIAAAKTYRYIINNAPFTSEIEIVKKDAETGKLIPASGVGFKVRNVKTGEYVVQHINYPTPTDIEIYYTDANGKLMLPSPLSFGDYEIIEQNAPEGYVLDGTPVAFTVDGTKQVVTVEKTNVPQKGTITVTKRGEVFSTVTEQDGVYQPVYEIKGLADAVYEIVAADDVVTPDGTTRYAKDEIVATVTTDADGNATSEPLYLGEYVVREITAPEGYVLNGEPVNVALTYAGETVAVTTAATEFVNERQKLVIELLKTLEQDETFGIGTGDEITHVKFALYAAEDLTAADGSVIPTDALIEIATCNKDGKIAFATDLPIGAKVYVKEYASDAHYVVSDTMYPVTFDYAGGETAQVTVALNDGAAIENTIIRGDIVGKKVDEDGFTICGALFGLFPADATEFTETTALLTCESNEIGVFVFENVPYGDYIVREIKAAPAFVLNEENHAVTVDTDGDVIELVIENKFIVGAVQVVKVDKDNADTKLSGAVFEIYVDVDRNKKFDADRDLRIGEMSETDTGVYRMDGLRYGGYFLHELTAPDGFIGDDGYYYFEIVADGETVTVENVADVGFVNEKIPTPEPVDPVLPPQTGDDPRTRTWAWIGVALSALMSGGLLISRRKKAMQK